LASSLSSKTPVLSPNNAALAERARIFTMQYQDNYPNLHLIKNNCWTFAWRLLQHLNDTEKDD